MTIHVAISALTNRVAIPISRRGDGGENGVSGTASRAAAEAGLPTFVSAPSATPSIANRTAPTRSMSPSRRAVSPTTRASFTQVPLREARSSTDGSVPRKWMIA